MKIFRLFVACTLICVALSPRAHAVSPPPDGGYPGGNTAEGQNALFSLTTGSYNTAVGYVSLASNNTNSFNTAIGVGALFANIANNNTATGAGALLSNTVGSANTANGAFALLRNTNAGNNTAIGAEALLNNDSTGTGSAFQNTAIGASALKNNIEGASNTGVGQTALFQNTTGSGNTAVGQSALVNNATIGADVGNNNTAVGVSALSSNTTGSNNIALGVIAGLALTTGNNNIDIGNAGVPAEAFTTRIGNLQTAAFIAGISGQTASGGVAVFVNADGKLGTSNSSARFKDEIKPMENASEAIFALKPVTFRYKKELDPKGIPQFGLVAEDVEKVNPDLVARDAKGEVYTVRYDQVNAMLLNEFLKEHKRVERLKNDFQSTVAQQQREIESLTAQLRRQAAQIQKVSAELEVSKPALKTVVTNH